MRAMSTRQVVPSVKYQEALREIETAKVQCGDRVSFQWGRDKVEGVVASIGERLVTITTDDGSDHLRYAHELQPVS